LDVVTRQKRSEALPGRVRSKIYEALGFAAAFRSEQGITLIEALPQQGDHDNKKHAYDGPD